MSAEKEKTERCPKCGTPLAYKHNGMSAYSYCPKEGCTHRDVWQSFGYVRRDMRAQ
jgi:uncharacterized Zn finger protein (UPF0148 family)